MPRQLVEPAKRDFAKSQRASMSAAERILWEAVRGGRLLGAKFKRQVPIGSYVVDFVCFDRRLIVETDGPLHGSAEAQRYDRRRDLWLAGQGFQTLRIRNDLVLASPLLAVRLIEEALSSPSPVIASR